MNATIQRSRCSSESQYRPNNNLKSSSEGLSAPSSRYPSSTSLKITFAIPCVHSMIKERVQNTLQDLCNSVEYCDQSVRSYLLLPLKINYLFFYAVGHNKLNLEMRPRHDVRRGIFIAKALFSYIVLTFLTRTIFARCPIR
jgi:hypothetical protein